MHQNPCSCQPANHRRCYKPPQSPHLGSGIRAHTATLLMRCSARAAGAPATESSSRRAAAASSAMRCSRAMSAARWYARRPCRLPPSRATRSCACARRASAAALCSAARAASPACTPRRARARGTRGALDGVCSFHVPGASMRWPCRAAYRLDRCSREVPAPVKWRAGMAQRAAMRQGTGRTRDDDRVSHMLNTRSLCCRLCTGHAWAPSRRVQRRHRFTQSCRRAHAGASHTSDMAMAATAMG